MEDSRREEPEGSGSGGDQLNVISIFNRYKVQTDGDRIYDPIRLKYVHLTPEEIVRQKTIKYLIKRLAVPEDKIIVERRLDTL